jgi:DNA-binding response OmpR family regulator
MMPDKITADGGAEILIAEDSPTQAEQLKHLLEKAGYTVTAAVNGKQALEAAHDRKPALIISDIMMPEMDGFGLCRHVKKDEELKDIPVILLTALSDPCDIMRGLQCGADNFITKPYDEDYLLSRVQYALLNVGLRKSDKMEFGVEVFFADKKYHITSGRLQNWSRHRMN